jgi:hypothetical protein
MLRVKVFSSATLGGDNNTLEDDINGWLESASPTIHQMTQCGSEGQIIITFLYESHQRETAAHMTGSAEAETFAGGPDDADFDQTDADDEPTLLPEVELPY